MEKSLANLTNHWSTCLLEQLTLLGVEDICIAPGSRNASLVIAAAQLCESASGPIRLHTHLDERGLGFYALGLSKSTVRPVVIITTSGTAVANLHPAVIEAFQSSVPLIVLSADRPEELLNCGANQAINQKNIFSKNVVAFSQIGPVENEEQILGNLDQVVKTYQQAILSGPVQINCAFREPLYPDINQPARESKALFQARSASEVCLKYTQASEIRQPNHKTLIIAGDLSHSEAEVVMALAERFGTPVIADVNSNLRQHRLVIQGAEMLLSARPELFSGYQSVIQFGGRIVGKRLLKWLAETPLEFYVLVSPENHLLDPSKRATQMRMSVETFCQQVVLTEFDHSDLLGVANIVERLSQRFYKELPLGELKAAQVICESVGHDVDLFVGNSLSIRLMDLQTQRNSTVFSNRGASGIDGLLATACGVHKGRDRAMIALLGDTSLLHDMNSLILAGRQKGNSPLVIVVLNNDGGSIFNLLPAADFGSIHRDFFQLPHGLGFEHLAQTFGITYYNPDSTEQLQGLLKTALLDSGATLIELQVPPAESSEQIKELFRYINTHLQDSKITI